MKNSTILIIEDDTAIRELYADALQLAGLEVLQARSGKAGVEMALTHHPAVILVDIMMPEMDGHEVVQKIRIDRWGKKAKVIYLTNFSEPVNVVKAFEQNPEEYIVKANTDVKEVVNKVRTAMHM